MINKFVQKIGQTSGRPQKQSISQPGQYVSTQRLGQIQFTENLALHVCIRGKCFKSPYTHSDTKIQLNSSRTEDDGVVVVVCVRRVPARRPHSQHP